MAKKPVKEDEFGEPAESTTESEDSEEEGEDDEFEDSDSDW
jgi:hypothetical protein